MRKFIRKISSFMRRTLKEIAEKSQAIDQELRDKQTETLQVDKLL